MPRKPPPPKLAPHLAGSQKLAVKDSLREVRFNLRLGVRKLAQAVEDVTHRHGEGPHTPMEVLSEFAVHTTATLLSNIDHAAVDLLGSDGPYRSMSIPLRSSTSYFVGPCRSDDLRSFTRDHHWRYRHWLKLISCRDVFVHEKAIELAGERIFEQVHSGISEGANLSATTTDSNLQVAVLVIRALNRADIFSRPALSNEKTEGELASLAALGAIVSVLAGEIALFKSNHSPRNQYLESLRLADEIALASRERWEHALRSPIATEAMAEWLAFVLRHV